MELKFRKYLFLLILNSIHPEPECKICINKRFKKSKKRPLYLRGAAFYRLLWELTTL